MAVSDRYEVIVVLPRGAAWQVIAGLEAASGISRFRARIATGDPMQNPPAWAGRADPADLIYRLPKQVLSYLVDAVRNGCGLAELRFVPESALKAISEGLDQVVLSDRASAQAYRRSMPERELPLGLAFPERGAGIPIQGGIHRIVAADIAPGAELAVTTDAVTTTLWRPATGDETMSIDTGGGDVSFVLGGSAVQIVRRDSRVFADTTTGVVLSEQSRDGVVAPGGALLAATLGGVVSVTDLRGRELWQASGDRFAWATDSRLFVSARASGSTTGHDARTGETVVRLPGYAPTPAPDGQTVITIDDSQLAVWDARTGELRTRLAGVAADTNPRGGQGSVAAYDPALRAVLVRHRNNTWLVVDSLTGEVNFQLDGYSADLLGAAGVVLTPDFAYDAVSGHELYRIGRASFVADPAGHSIALSLPPLRRSIREALRESGEQTQVLDARSGRPRFLAAGRPLRFDERGSVLVTALDDGRAALYDAKSGRQFGSLGTIRVLSALEAPDLGRAIRPSPGGIDVSFEMERGRVPGPGSGTRSAVPSGPESAVNVAEVEHVLRYVTLTGPDAVVPEIPFDIQAALVRDRPADLPQASAVELLPTQDEAGALTGAPVVSFTCYAAPAFTMLSSRNISVEVRPHSDPEPVAFRLVAKADASGPHECSVVLWQGALVIGRVKFVIKIEADPRHPKLVRRGLTVPVPGEQAAAPEVAIYVSRVSAGGRDTLHYSYSWPARGWPRVEAGSVELLTTADRWLDDKLALLSRAARGRASGSGFDADGEPAGREFERIGENLYSQLFTDELRDFYAKFAPETKSLLIFSDEPWIPWELVKPWGGGIDGDFLCAQFELSRWYYSRSCRVPKSDLVVREVAPIIPQSDLAATAEEARFFLGLPEQWPSVALHWPVTARRSEVLGILSGGLTQLVHFAAHGSLRVSGGIAAIELTDGLLRAEDIVGNLIESGLASATPVVFMNACHTGRQVIGLTRPDGWVERCIDLGCRGFLGANWEVSDQLAATFAIEVYTRLMRRSPIAAAVREARAVLRSLDPANPTWLSYSLYAHPKMTLLTAGSSAQ